MHACRSSAPTITDRTPRARKQLTSRELEAAGKQVEDRAIWCVDFGGHMEAMSTMQLWCAVSRGDVPALTKVWCPGMECWTPAAALAELKCAFKEARKHRKGRTVRPRIVTQPQVSTEPPGRVVEPIDVTSYRPGPVPARVRRAARVRGNVWLPAAAAALMIFVGVALPVAAERGEMPDEMTPATSEFAEDLAQAARAAATESCGAFASGRQCAVRRSPEPGATRRR